VSSLPDGLTAMTAATAGNGRPPAWKPAKEKSMSMGLRWGCAAKDRLAAPAANRRTILATLMMNTHPVGVVVAGLERLAACQRDYGTELTSQSQLLPGHPERHKRLLAFIQRSSFHVERPRRGNDSRAAGFGDSGRMRQLADDALCSAVLAWTEAKNRLTAMVWPYYHSP
jgi:hypothetical protein